MTAVRVREPNEYFDGALGWLGPDGPVSFNAAKLIRIDRRSLMTAFASRFGFRAFNRAIFIDWSGGVYGGPHAGRRFGGYVIPLNEAAMWTERHRAARRDDEHQAYYEIVSRGYPTVTLEVPRSAEHQWQWGTTYDPIHDPAGAKLWLQRN